MDESGFCVLYHRKPRMSVSPIRSITYPWRFSKACPLPAHESWREQAGPSYDPDTSEEWTGAKRSEIRARRAASPASVGWKDSASCAPPSPSAPSPEEKVGLRAPGTRLVGASDPGAAAGNGPTRGAVAEGPRGRCPRSGPLAARSARVTAVRLDPARGGGSCGPDAPTRRRSSGPRRRPLQTRAEKDTRICPRSLLLTRFHWRSRAGRLLELLEGEKSRCPVCTHGAAPHTELTWGYFRFPRQLPWSLSEVMRSAEPVGELQTLKLTQCRPRVPQMKTPGKGMANRRLSITRRAPEGARSGSRASCPAAQPSVTTSRRTSLGVKKKTPSSHHC
ncbi:uncharacterized protein LOC116582776 [Mustela erminea]|uniref:uncharacterized protein LOC116582776 n=1 Tax=Mustela erminea TaxID=36723 RepID=UPI0013872ADD|nr:uncharacterized protein LOC116582776 [Mustela erminea]